MTNTRETIRPMAIMVRANTRASRKRRLEKSSQIGRRRGGHFDGGTFLDEDVADDVPLSI
jgi:hypothetical protein